MPDLYRYLYYIGNPNIICKYGPPYICVDYVTLYVPKRKSMLKKKKLTLRKKNAFT